MGDAHPSTLPGYHPTLQAEEGYQAQLQQEMQQLRERQYDDSELDAVGRMQARYITFALHYHTLPHLYITLP